MKHILLFLFVVPIVSFSQCPPDGSFTSQAQIDAFAAAYPDCTVLNSSLLISGDDITNLNGLFQIVECHNLIIQDNALLQNLSGLNPNILLDDVYSIAAHSLIIKNNASLVNINGLENLENETSVLGEIWISDNPLLSSLVGMPTTFVIESGLTIKNNDALTNLIGLGNYINVETISIRGNDGLLNLVGLDTPFAEDIIILDNNSLQNLEGIENLRVYDDVIIENNLNLNDISDLINILGLPLHNLRIRNNPNLSMCNTDFICYFLQLDGVVEGVWLPGIFENNGIGCSTNFEVEYSCGLVTNDDCGLYNTPDNLMLNLGESITANNEFATMSPEAPSCNDIPDRKDVWFLFNSEENTTVDIIVDEGFNLQLWESTSTQAWATCGNKTQVENACGSSELLDVSVTPNTFYIVQVWNNDSGRLATSTPGWFNLIVQGEALTTEDFTVNQVELFPNPTTHQLTIQADSIIQHLKVHNLLGQEVYHSTPNVDYSIIDTSAFSQGMYLVTVTVNGSESTYKIVKQ